MPPSKPHTMHPRDFTVNHTWLAFRVNQVPVETEDGAFDIFVLQDAASMFIFGTVFAPDGAESPAEAEIELLMERAWSHGNEWPAEIVLPGKPSPKNAFARVARRHGVTVRTVAESQMSFYIKDVQTSIEEMLGGGDT